MFSTMPSTGTFTRWNICKPLRASISDISCGVVTITAPASGSAFGAGPVTVEGTLDDAIFSTLTLNGAAVSVAADGTWSTALALDEGLNVVTAIARDQAGNIGTDSIELVLDTRSQSVEESVALLLGYLEEKGYLSPPAEG